MNLVELERIARSTIPPVKASGLCLIVDHEPGGKLANGAPSGVGGRTRFGPAWIIDSRVKSAPIALFDRQADAHRLLALLRGEAPTPRSAPVIPTSESLGALAEPDQELIEAPKRDLPGASLPGPETTAVRDPLPSSGIRLCANCGGPMPDEAFTGRPRKTCSDACRQALRRDVVDVTRKLAESASNGANIRARHLGIVDKLRARDVLALWEREPVCVRCGSGRGLDHVIAMVDGGANTPDNLQNLCQACNQAKETETRRTRPVRVTKLAGDLGGADAENAAGRPALPTAPADSTGHPPDPNQTTSADPAHPFPGGVADVQLGLPLPAP